MTRSAVERPETTGACPVLCRIRPRPRSVRMRPWAAELRERLTVLDWCAARLRAVFPRDRHVLVVDAVDAESLTRRSAGAYEFLVSHCWADVDAWLDAAQQLGAEQIIAAQLEAALCPANLCARLNEALDPGVGLAYCGSLPSLVAPERVRISSAAALRRAVADRGAGETFADLFGLAELAKVDDIQGWPCKRVRIDGQPRLHRFSHISFESSADVATLRSIHDGGEPLDRWFEERAVQLRHERLRAVAPSSRPRLSSSPLRVLFVSNPSAVSGAESSTVELIEALARREVESAALVAFEGDFTDRLRSAGCRVYCQDRDFLSDDIESWNTVADAVRDFHPDLLHYCGRSGRTPLQVAAGMGLPLVFHGHVPFPEPYRDAIGWANKYVAVSTSAADAMRAAGLHSDSIVVVPNGIQAASYTGLREKRQLFRQEFGLSETAFVAITLSRFSPEKRLNDVIEAVSLARRDGADVELLMAGEGNSDRTTVGQITARIQELKLASVVRLPGQVTDIRPILGLADAMVICSTYEGLPMAALEAMATGIPLIATEAGGLADLVGEVGTPGICGLRVRTGEPADIAAALTRLQEHPELWTTLSRQRLRLVGGPYSIETTADRIMAVYKEVCQPTAIGGSLPWQTTR